MLCGAGVSHEGVRAVRPYKQSPFNAGRLNAREKCRLVLGFKSSRI